MLTRPEETKNVPTDLSYGSVIKELSTTITRLVGSEVNLIRAEMKTCVPNLLKDATQAGLFGALLALSFLPLMAAAIIGLGILFGGMYWLSALLVGALMAGFGFFKMQAAIARLKKHDLSFPKSRAGLNKSFNLISAKLGDVNPIVTGDSRESNSIH